MAIRAHKASDGTVFEKEYAKCEHEVTLAVRRIFERKFPKTHERIAKAIIMNAYEIQSLLTTLNRSKAPTVHASNRGDQE